MHVQHKYDVEINAWHGSARDVLLHARTRNLAAHIVVFRRSGSDGDGNNGLMLLIRSPDSTVTST